MIPCCQRVKNGRCQVSKDRRAPPRASPLALDGRLRGPRSPRVDLPGWISQVGSPRVDLPEWISLGGSPRADLPGRGFPGGSLRVHLPGWGSAGGAPPGGSPLVDLLGGGSPGQRGAPRVSKGLGSRAPHPQGLGGLPPPEDREESGRGRPGRTCLRK